MKFLCKLFYKKNNVLNALSFLFRSKFRTRRNSMQVQCQKKEAVAKHPVQKKTVSRISKWMYFQQVWGTTEVYTGPGLGYIKGRDKLEGVGVHGRTRKTILEKQDGMAWTGFIWLEI